MSELKTYIEQLKEKYGDSAVTAERSPGADAPDVPEPLREFYTLYESMALPFGEIYRADDREAQQYFRENGWFCFGFDGYFSYWLCSFEPDADGLWLTSWDHDSDTDIEAVWDDLTSFLRAMEEAAEELGNI